MGYLGSDGNKILSSLPMFSYFSDIDVADIPMQFLEFQFIDPTNSLMINNFKKALVSALPGQKISITDHTSTGGGLTTEKITSIMNKVFNSIIAVIMSLCFFALSANMSANLYEQTKEIGVLRSIGFSKWKIRFIYFYEAIVLVLSACLMGVVVGMTVGYTMVLQQTLFMSISLEFFFPWSQFIVILVLSVICAIFSTFGPTTVLTNKQIAAIFRLV